MSDGRKLPVFNGIDSFEVKSAREMVALTTRSRLPQRVSAIPTTSTAATKSTFPKTKRTQAEDGECCKFKYPHVKVTSGHPQCEHCGRMITPSPVATMPIRETPSIEVGDWKIITTRNPILNSEELDVLESQLKIPLPEMIFGNSQITVYNPVLEQGLKFCSNDALALVKLDHVDVKVSYAKEWYQSREQKHKNNEEIMGSYQDYDWTYTTEYRGTPVGKNTVFEKTEQPIPLDKLSSTHEPILLFDDMILFEDELGDNGCSVLSCKIRVMPTCLLILQRFFLRVDNVLLRVYDTRFYIDFETGLIMREFKQQQEDYETIEPRLMLNNKGDPRSLLRDPNWVSQNLRVVSVNREVMVPPHTPSA